MAARKFITIAISTFFYVGYLPLIPGTFGSLAGLCVYYLFKDNYRPDGKYENVTWEDFIDVRNYKTRKISNYQASEYVAKKDHLREIIYQVNGYSVTFI